MWIYDKPIGSGDICILVHKISFELQMETIIVNVNDLRSYIMLLEQWSE